MVATHAVSVPLGRPFAPYGDAPADLWVTGRRLAEAQMAALAAHRVPLVAVARENEPRIEFADHLWFTPALVRRFLDQVPAGGGQLRVAGPFLDATAALQDLDDGRLPMWFVPAGKRREDVPPATIDLAVEAKPVPKQHVALDGAETRPIAVTDAMAHTLSHWVHLHRVNLLAWLAYGEGERRRITASWWRTALATADVVNRAGGFDPHAIAQAIGQQGKSCRVHPLAVVETSVLGDDVEVGPFAVVRGSWIGAGAKITEHARVAGSVVGAGCTVARGTNLQLSVMLPGSYVSEGRGHQACLFGRDAFVAVGVTTFDLSFGGEIEVDTPAGRRSAGTRFLGCAVGHRARIGPHVRINYGEAIPNDAMLVGDADAVARNVPAALEPGAHVVREGRVVPVRKPG